MDQVPLRTLNQDTAAVLARVEQGEIIEVTDHGRPVARIVPVSTTPTMAHLIASGVVLPPTVPGPIPMPTTAAEPGPEGGRLISALRDEDRWW